MNDFPVMPFAEFANTLKPSGAVNRLPSIGVGEEVFSYSVYMNGPLAKSLPAEVQEFQFKDVMVYALTEKLNLDSGSFRDNLKVAELVATRNAWMMAILEATKSNSMQLSEQVMDDYSKLTQGLSHPYIVNELNKQRALSSGLQPALDNASLVVGNTVKDRAPLEISTGKVVSQSMDFTMQALTNGGVVTHENRRLESLPKVGENVTIAYYRGSGQVFESHEKLRVSAPFIDKDSGDLAVSLIEESGKAKKIVLFNSISSFAKFVTAQGLDPALLESAVDVRVATPKIVPEKSTAARELVSDVYINEPSGCLSIDYKEKGNTYSVLFGSAKTMEANATEYGLNANHIAKGKALEIKQSVSGPEVEDKSLNDLVRDLQRLNVKDIADAASDGRVYVGKVVSESALHMAQDMGRGVVMIHDKRELDKLPKVGDSFTVKYEKGSGKVSELVRAQDKGLGR